jgi:ferredoxin
MLIKVDAGKCQGHGRCYALAPGLFDLDENGNALAKDGAVPPDQVELAEIAASNCPERAITLE